ncbi:hypothetical protein [Mycolicibacterium smegmatis]|uniref:Phytanoyl-CoA dioxygenase family protein n=1 Tax=Mycolicibacterium smegmatis (strain MKD8) TaxID=1214915 RepID=A0A2U9PZZ8_MYCSE|nr:hypothetical protein [Mycolicibacterium smegmatis]AWT56795.1 hypothetical protein D806_058550 [Mycolicibacterium smegmatis MKD8]
MTTIHFNPVMSDGDRRASLYKGEVLLFGASPESLAFVAHAQDLIADAFRKLDPQTAQYEMPVEEFAAVLADLKPKFIHHPKSKELIRALLASFGCDLDRTYFDVPRMRTSTSDGFLTSGISYAFHAHRDTWYSAPFCQLNWWIPIFPVVPENVMEFHPRYWGTPVRNGSRRYNYYEWNGASRTEAAQHIKTDTRDQPKPEEELELEPSVRCVPEAAGVMIFSGNQLHSTVPNTSGRTRFSIDFRTVHIDDVVTRTEAPNFDSECTGTSLRDFIRARDFVRIPEDVALDYEGLVPSPHRTGD